MEAETSPLTKPCKTIKTERSFDSLLIGASIKVFADFYWSLVCNDKV
jgi:hypothetical protein